MMDVLFVEVMWRTALAAIPLALLVALISRALPCRPSTRHLMWVSVLVILVIAPFLPRMSEANTKTITDTAQDLVAKAAQLMPPAMEASAAEDSNNHSDTETRADRARPLPGLSNHEASIWDAKLTERTLPVAFNDARQPSAWQTDRRSAAFYPETNDRTTPSYQGARRPDIEPAPEVDWSRVHADVFDDDFAQAQKSPVKIGGTDEGRTKGIVEPSPLPPIKADSLLTDWMTQLAVVRDVLSDLPPIPGSLWLGGMALLLLVLALRVGESLRFLRLGKPAPRWVIEEVQRAAKDLDLKRMPITLMVDSRISPMVWCGRNVKLVLPESLWEQLDEVGRGAVIRHELAHLRRRDHWVAWADLAAGILYWWHPVVWWIRRRIRDEADLCCDAWVTALVPDGRRAYAEALLETKKFVSAFVPAGPVMGLGVTTLRAKTFARRIKMVMTEQKTPGWSMAGIALAVVLLVAGCIVTPIWACPPSEKTKPSQTYESATKIRIIAPTTRSDETEDTDASTFEKYMNQREGGKTYKKYDGPKKIRVTAPAAKYGTVTFESDCECECVCCQTRCVMATNSSDSPCFFVKADGLVYVLPTDGETNGGRTLVFDGGQTVKLSDGVVYSQFVTAPLAAQYATLVTMGDEDDEDEETSRKYSLPEGKLRDLIRLMARDDVPVLIRPHDDVIEVLGTSRQQAIFRAFVNMIHPEGADESDDFEYIEVEEHDAWEEHEGEWEEEHENEWEEDEETYEAWEQDRRREHERQWRRITADFERATRDLERQVKQIQRQQERTHEQADRVRDKADKLRDKADECRDEAERYEKKAEETESESKIARYLEKAAELAMKAEQCEAESEAMEAEADSMMDEAEALEEQAEAIEEQAEELQEQLEELEEELEEQFEQEQEDEDEDDGCWDDDDDDDDDWEDDN